jgi:hypothetical protein
MLSNKFIAKTRTMKGLTITFQWVNEEPAMCILRNFMNRKTAYVVCLSSAYKYGDVSYLVKQSALAAEVLGGKDDRALARAVADVILECLEDLVKMAPEPEESMIERGAAMGKATYDKRENMIVIH